MHEDAEQPSLPANKIATLLRPDCGGTNSLRLRPEHGLDKWQRRQSRPARNNAEPGLRFFGDIMHSVEQAVEDTCAFLSRFLAGERGFTTEDVLAGISRLRELHHQNADAVNWKPAMRTVRRCCQKLDRKVDYKWACED
jgi:hypothetical protein